MNRQLVQLAQTLPRRRYQLPGVAAPMKRHIMQLYDTLPQRPEFTQDHKDQHLIHLAQTLPPRLLNFFRKYPPPALMSQNKNWKPPTAPPTTPEDTVVASTTSSADPNAPAAESVALEQQVPNYHNPFLPRKNFKTGKWYGPVYGLRKQADLVKLAQKHGVLNLLPYSIKLPEVRLKRRLEGGLRVKGTGVGQKVKGKMWERTLKGRLEKRKQAMLDMPRLVQEWKQKGHGRGWKKYPR
jgi:large subunit ribosomal protein L25